MKYLFILFVLSTTAFAEIVYKDADLEIAAFDPSDEKAFIRIATDPVVLKQANGVLDVPGAKEWFQACISKDHSRGFMLRDPRTKQAMGVIMMDEHGSGFWETSTAILEEFQSRKLGQRARAATTDYAFRTLKFPGLLSRISDDNGASIHVTKKLGFTFTGETTKDHTQRPAVWLDFRLSREKYLGLNPPPILTQKLSDVAMRLSKIARKDGDPMEKPSQYYSILAGNAEVRSQLSLEQLARLSDDMISMKSPAEIPARLKARLCMNLAQKVTQFLPGSSPEE